MESFYRVEDATGVGPYQNNDNRAMLYNHSGRADHLSPYSSGGYFVQKEDLCGFRTMQDLFRWFGGWLPGLIQDGYRVVKVTGKPVYEDCCQVVFKPRYPRYSL